MPKATLAVIVLTAVAGLSACAGTPDAQRQKVIQELNSFNNLCHDNPKADECVRLTQQGSGA